MHGINGSRLMHARHLMRHAGNNKPCNIVS
jgi:hypothetical protein